MLDIPSKITGSRQLCAREKIRATTQFDATKVHSSGFVAPYTPQGLIELCSMTPAHAKKDALQRLL